jgi:uncharacterized protein (TIGR00251 family)
MTAAWLCYRAEESRLMLRIHAQPNAKSTAVCGLHGDALKLRIAAPAVDDKANAAMLSWLAAALDVPRSALRIKAGGAARRKTVEIRPADASLLSRAESLAG